MQIAADNIDKLLAVEMRRRGIPRGFKWRIFEIARAVHDEVKNHVGSNKITAAAEKGLTSYEAVRERIREASGQ